MSALKCLGIIRTVNGSRRRSQDEDKSVHKTTRGGCRDGGFVHVLTTLEPSPLPGFEEEKDQKWKCGGEEGY